MTIENKKLFSVSVNGRKEAGGVWRRIWGHGSFSTHFLDERGLANLSVDGQYLINTRLTEQLEREKYR